MALRNFIDRNGKGWRVWSVLPQVSSGAGVPPALRRGWLCFAPERGEGRLRLPLEDVPTAWDSLPDDRLDLLRRVAALAPSVDVGEFEDASATLPLLRRDEARPR
jgi:hypothetical protein